MPRVICPALAEPGGEGRFFSGGGEVWKGAEFRDAEGGDPMPPLLREKCGDGRGQAAEAVPQGHGRTIQEMAQDDALHAEMAEEGNTVVIRGDGAVKPPVSFVSVAEKQGVQPFAYRKVLFADIGLGEGLRGHPGRRIEEGRLRAEILGKPVPGDGGLFLVRTPDLRVEFPEPGAGFRGDAQSVKGISGRGAGAPQGRLVRRVNFEVLFFFLF